MKEPKQAKLKKKESSQNKRKIIDAKIIHLFSSSTAFLYTKVSQAFF